MPPLRFRLRTIMIVVAVAALGLTLVIQSVLLRRAAVAKQNELAAAQQSAAVDPQSARMIADTLKSFEGMANDCKKMADDFERMTDDFWIESERTRGGFNRSIRRLDKPSIAQSP